jgi:hypothetical protein
MGSKRKPPSFKKLVRDAIKRCGSQEKLAQELHRGRTAISMWITGSHKPKLEAVIALAKISPYPDRYFLWKLAGLDDRTIELAARDLLGEREAEPGERILVPQVRPTSQGLEQIGHNLPFARQTIPEQASPGYITVDEELRSGGLAAGDILLLDTYIRDAKDPRPFWGEPVLIRFTPEPNLDYPDAIYVGKIWIDRGLARPYSLWAAVLWPWPGFEIDRDVGMVQRLGVGVWPETVDMKNPHPSEGEALEALRLRPGVSLLARVIGWFGPGMRKR